MHCLGFQLGKDEFVLFGYGADGPSFVGCDTRRCSAIRDPLENVSQSVRQLAAGALLKDGIEPRLNVFGCFDCFHCFAEKGRSQFGFKTRAALLH